MTELSKAINEVSINNENEGNQYEIILSQKSNNLCKRFKFISFNKIWRRIY